MSRIAIVAALEREVRSLVRQWPRSDQEHDGRRYRFFEKDDVVLVCGGVGAEAARRAAEAVIVLFAPTAVYSVGFAGALDPALKVGDVVQPQRVVNASDGSIASLSGGEGVLVSFASVASREQKAKLRASFGSQAVDMEAAAVARAAEARGIGFGAVKVISDEVDFAFPAMERFVSPEGRFWQTKFVVFTAIRPWLWLRVARLARNSNRASRALCHWLHNMTVSWSPASASRLEAVNRR